MYLNQWTAKCTYPLEIFKTTIMVWTKLALENRHLKSIMEFIIDAQGASVIFFPTEYFIKSEWHTQNGFFDDMQWLRSSMCLAKLSNICPGASNSWGPKNVSLSDWFQKVPWIMSACYIDFLSQFNKRVLEWNKCPQHLVHISLRYILLIAWRWTGFISMLYISIGGNLSKRGNPSIFKHLVTWYSSQTSKHSCIFIACGNCDNHISSQLSCPRLWVSED